LLFFFFFKPFAVISNFKRVFLSSYNKFNHHFLRGYNLLFFKNFFGLSLNYSLLGSLFFYYSNFDIKKFVFSNFLLYFNFPFFFINRVGFFDLGSKFFYFYFLANTSFLFFRSKKRIKFFLPKQFDFLAPYESTDGKRTYLSLFDSKFFYLRYLNYSFVNFFVYKFYKLFLYFDIDLKKKKSFFLKDHSLSFFFRSFFFGSFCQKFNKVKFFLHSKSQSVKEKKDYNFIFNRRPVVYPSRKIFLYNYSKKYLDFNHYGDDIPKINLRFFFKLPSTVRFFFLRQAGRGV
jgi:hypothetical protein